MQSGRLFFLFENTVVEFKQPPKINRQRCGRLEGEGCDRLEEDGGAEVNSSNDFAADNPVANLGFKRRRPAIAPIAGKANVDSTPTIIRTCYTLVA